MNCLPVSLMLSALPLASAVSLAIDAALGYALRHLPPYRRMPVHSFMLMVLLVNCLILPKDASLITSALFSTVGYTVGFLLPGINREEERS